MIFCYICSRRACKLAIDTCCLTTHPERRYCYRFCPFSYRFQDSLGFKSPSPLQWRHNERDDVSYHRRLGCLLNHLIRHRSKKTSKLRVTGLCEGNSRVTGEFPSQRTSNAENVSIWWRHHEKPLSPAVRYRASATTQCKVDIMDIVFAQWIKTQTATGAINSINIYKRYYDKRLSFYLLYAIFKQNSWIWTRRPLFF